LLSITELWFNGAVKKTEAIKILGGSVAKAAEAIGISYQAVAKWPETLTRRIEDRVIAAQLRLTNSPDLQEEREHV